MSINQELLRTFVAAAESESFSRAAERRHVTKAAVSQQIKALEGQLGVVLFERSGGHARVTESGRALAGVLRRQFEVIDDAIAAVASSQRGVAGEVRVGTPGPFTRLWLRPRLSRLLQAHEALRVTVVFGTPRDLERRLAERELDLLILGGSARSCAASPPGRPPRPARGASPRRC
jgi:DNA-binding transcriptional LysR family regulator